MSYIITYFLVGFLLVCGNLLYQIYCRKMPREDRMDATAALIIFSLWPICIIHTLFLLVSNLLVKIGFAGKIKDIDSLVYDE